VCVAHRLSERLHPLNGVTESLQGLGQARAILHEDGLAGRVGSNEPAGARHGRPGVELLTGQPGDQLDVALRLGVAPHGPKHGRRTTVLSSHCGSQGVKRAPAGSQLVDVPRFQAE